MKYSSIYGGNYELSFMRGEYQNNKSLAIQIMCQEEGEDFIEPFATLTVNLQNPPSEKNCAYVDTNNCPMDLIQMLEDAGYMTETDEVQFSGYCVYPLYRFNQSWLDLLKVMR